LWQLYDWNFISFKENLQSLAAILEWGSGKADFDKLRRDKVGKVKKAILIRYWMTIKSGWKYCLLNSYLPLL